jgi:hypothetical protein
VQEAALKHRRKAQDWALKHRRKGSAQETQIAKGSRQA